ncbi:MAG: Methyl-accepting chemotaxis protein signaling domain [Herbinix sp.]|nr:Methyl-accepting chemotaxis protein signaling domain [Herbinix sp.]MDF2870033.1 Methyl-accepting chemotaxis protein signaling domain [Anaerocolumna sp.]
MRKYYRKGFAVVAHEIGKLAAQSKEFALKITKSIDLLFDRSTSSLSIASEVTNRINSQNEKLESTIILFQKLI